MSELYADYKKDKRGTLNLITDSVSRQISEMLVKLDTIRTPMLLS
jgi:hypothetical protein